MNILAIGAHPDDLEFGCGGTLLKLSQSKKNNIALFVFTKGEGCGSRIKRQSEQEKAGRILHAKRIYWGGYRDTHIPIDKGPISQLDRVMATFNPHLIFVNYSEDSHQDHRAVAACTVSATRYIPNVLMYEVPTTNGFNPSVFVDITHIIDEKLRLLEAHKSQVFATRIAGLSIADAASSCANFRGYQARVKYAEGFVPIRLRVFL